MTTAELAAVAQRAFPKVDESKIKLIVAIFAVLKNSSASYRTAEGETIQALTPAYICQDLRDYHGYRRLGADFKDGAFYRRLGLRTVRAQYVGGVRAKQFCEVVTLS